MKSHQVIAESLSTWRTVESAVDLAHETFHQLDDDERERLALRAYTDEVRATLRRKHKGVPAYSNVDRLNPATGQVEQVYKQTEAFDVEDYKMAVRSYGNRARQNLNVAKALAEKCRADLGVQLPIPFASSDVA